MPRINIPASVTIQFDNPIQPPAFGAPCMLTQISVATNADGVAVSQPAHHQFPMVPDDITDELIAALDSRLKSIGLTVSRIA